MEKFQLLGSPCKGQNNNKLLCTLTFLIFLAVVRIPNVISKTSISDSGGYTFSISFEKSIPAPSNVQGFLDELTNTLQIFSEELHRSTKGFFYVEAVKVNIPQRWSVDSEEMPFGNFTEESFHSSDIKISEFLSYPYTHNINACGHSGEFIQLPLAVLNSSFVEIDPATPNFGLPWKVLLNQWATYRWGVQPEHGFPRDSKFPYFYQKYGTNDWEAATCSNDNIVGEYLNQYDETCNTTNIYPPPSSCKFQPSNEPNNAAITSSLMAFHWIDSITEFCDETTHIPDTPNPQNFYCKHRSVMEIMNTTSDYHSVTNPLPVVPDVKVDINFYTSKPILYILVDNDLTGSIPGDAHDVIRSSLINMYSSDPEDEVWSGVLSTIKIFSPNSGSNFLEAVVPFEEVANNADEFTEGILDLKFDNKNVTDFTRSINQAFEEIMSLKHEEGVILFIIKIGTEQAGYFGNALYEEELFLKLYGQNIHVIGLELLENRIMQSHNLERIANEYGKYYSVRKLDDLKEIMGDISSNVKEMLRSENGITQLSKTQPIYTSHSYGYESNEFQILQDEYASIFITLTSVNEITNVTLNSEDLELQLKNEWMANEIVDPTARFVYFQKVDIDSSSISESLWNITFECEEVEIDDCNALVVIYGTTKSPIENKVQLEVSTSVQNGESTIPLIIYARVTTNDMPIIGLGSIYAVIEDSNNKMSSWKVPLSDNGNGLPDLIQADGIYTGIFAPDLDYHTPGMSYQIRIHAFHSSVNDGFLSTKSIQSRLLPVNQENIPCFNGGSVENSCDGILPTTGFNRIINYPVGFTFTGESSFLSFPYRTSDFSYKALDNYKIELTWTSPVVIGTDAGVTSTEIRRSNSLKLLLDNFEAAEEVVILNEAQVPGSESAYEIEGTLEEFYYAIRTTFNGQLSDVSNIIDVKPREKEILPQPEIVSYGYEITVGIDEDSQIPANISAFLDQIYESIEELSEQIFRTTDKAFYIKSAPIVIPSKWIFNVDEPTVKSFKTSEIRITSSISNPRAENPNACGVVGNFIEFPHWFFEADGEVKYGARWKTMLNLWARYRWGIWEEHGYPYSMEFPYFYKKPGDNFWGANGCFDQQIQGEFLNGTGDVCENTGDYAPGTDCKFIPSEENSAKSSIMSFHWMDSVINFCDETTHNRESPNRQNKFCKHKSSMEVIKAMPEFGTGTIIDERPKLIKQIHKATNSPLLYILLDGGVNSISLPAMQNITSQISSLFDNGKLKDDTFVKMSIFENEGYESLPNSVLPSWETVKSVRDLFKSEIQNFRPDGSLKRNFAFSLLQVIQELASLQHKPGAVILMLKTGTGGSLFEFAPNEDEMNALIREHNINLYALESRTNAFTSIHLRNLASNTNGRHLQLINGVNLGNIVTAISIRLNNPILGSKHRFMYRGFFDTPYVEVPITFYTHGLSTVYISFTTSQSVSNATFLVSPGAGTWNGMEEMLDWNEQFDETRRKVYRVTYITNQENLGEELELKLRFECKGSVPACGTNTLIMYGETSSFSEPSEIDSSEISITTTAIENNVDLAQVADNLVPFAIYAKVGIGSLQVINIQSVKATLKLLNSNTYSQTVFEIPMFDNGNRVPDTIPNDGIYSAQFLPPIDGTYEISVSIEHSLSSTRLLPIDQNIVCFNYKCNGIEPKEPYIRNVRYPHTITVIHSSEWTNREIPVPILDLTAWALNDYNVSISWTSPSGINYPSDQPVSSYKLCEASTLDDILQGSYTTATVLQPSVPGTKETFIFQGLPDTIYYFAVITDHNGQESKLSNIVGIITRAEELVTTPITLPPITTTPWATTEEITEPPIPTKPPTTQPPSSTSEEPTTTEDTVYWFEKPEGYITLSIFGALAILLIIGSIIFLYLRNQSLTKKGLRQLLLRNESGNP